MVVQEGELHIHNSDGQQQATILREDLPGFIFESNRNTKHSFTAETSLGPEFHAGWTGRRGKRFRSKVEAMKQKVLQVSTHFLFYFQSECKNDVCIKILCTVKSLLFDMVSLVALLR